MKTITLQEAVALIPDGARLMIGGFMGVGTPEPFMDELVPGIPPGNAAARGLRPGAGLPFR